MQFRYTNDSANSLTAVSLRSIQEAGQIFCLLSILIFRFHLVSNKDDWNNWNLLYLLVSTRAVMGQFSGPYSPVRPAKFKVDSVAKLFCDLSPTVLNFYSK